MAITIQAPQAPTQWMPAGNALNYTINSDQTSQSDFFYLIDVQINGSSVIKLRRFPVMGSSIIVDVREIVDAFVSSTIHINANVGTTFFTPDYWSLVVVATENYGGQAYNSATAPEIEIWNAAAQFDDEQQLLGYYLKNYKDEFRYLGITDYARPQGIHNVGGGTSLIQETGYVQATPEALANAYSMHRAFSREAQIFANVTANSTPYIVFLGIDATGKVVKKYARSFDVQTSKTNALIKCVIGCYNTLTDCPYGAFYFASTNRALDVLDDFTSYPVFFKFADCDEAFGIYYKSYEGSWQFVQCNKRAIEITAVETTTRESIRPTAWAADTRLITSVNVHAQGRWALNTDWISSAINDDVKDMLQSPTLFIMHYHEGKLEYIPVTLLNADYVTKQHNDVNLFNYRFEFAEAFYKNTIKK